MLTVASLIREFGLEVVAGRESAERPIRWVHASEHADPTPWLAGGELLLTTGYNLRSPQSQRRFVQSLSEREVAGLGFGTGFDHSKIPRSLLSEAEKQELPVFEVPYEMPFIALTERAFTELVNEQYSVLERGIEVHGRLEALVLAERGLGEILGAIGEAVNGTALLLDERGREIARQPTKGGVGAAATRSIRAQVAKRSSAGHYAPFVPDRGPLAERAIAVPVPAGRGTPRRWLVAARRRGPVGDLERLLTRHSATVVALELMRERAVRETERRLAGDVLAEALSGRLSSDELTSRLRPFGIEEQAAVLVFAADDPSVIEAPLEAYLAEAGVNGLVAVTTVASRPLLCAVVDPGDGSALDLAAEVRRVLLDHSGTLRAAVSRVDRVEFLRRSFHEARCALEATALGNGDRPEVASHRDLGAFTLLLSLQDEDALRAYADSLLAPIEEAGGKYGGELLRSLEAFIEQNGQWERAARDLFCHRHTLRYRIRRIEELTGRDLSRAHDRIELWLALRARELVR